MATQLKLRRGTTAQHSAFTGAEGEITVDTTKKTAVVHDGTTVGGIPLATEASKLNAVNPSYTGTLTGGAGVVDIGSGQLYKQPSGNVGIGTSSPSEKLSVAGTVQSTSGGFKFPDGSIQISAAGGSFSSGTLMLFQQTAAPTGWTKQTTHDNKALRVVSGTAGSGGAVAFTTAFAAGSTGATTLTIAQMPSHSHSYTTVGGSRTSSGSSFDVGAAGANTGAAGGGGSHTHSLALNVSYVDLIIASKD